MLNTYIIIGILTAALCSEGRFQCGDGQCISIDLYCDYIQHCADGSDEINCGKHYRFRCTDFRKKANKDNILMIVRCI